MNLQRTFRLFSALFWPIYVSRARGVPEVCKTLHTFSLIVCKLLQFQRFRTGCEVESQRGDRAVEQGRKRKQLSQWPVSRLARQTGPMTMPSVLVGAAGSCRAARDS
jgi:hypothetical protein